MPARAAESAGKRRYRWKGREYPSVTTILGAGIAKPALVPWAAKMVAEYAVDNIDELARRAATDRDDAVGYIKGAHWKAKRSAGLKGTEIHNLAEAHATGQPLPPVSASAVPYVQALTDFLRDHRPEPLLTEKTVFSLAHNYAGTFDSVADFPEFGRVLFDWKTSKGVYPETALQLAAYAHADFWDDDESGECLPDVDMGMVVHLSPSGYALYKVDIGPEVFKAFLGCATVARFVDELGKQVLTSI